MFLIFHLNEVDEDVQGEFALEGWLIPGPWLPAKGPDPRQRTRFDIRPRYHVVNQVTQCSIITMVTALKVEWPTDCDRSLTPPIGKTSR
jgi:hypothetical protein